MTAGTTTAVKNDNSIHQNPVIHKYKSIHNYPLPHSHRHNTHVHVHSRSSSRTNQNNKKTKTKRRKNKSQKINTKTSNTLNDDRDSLVPIESDHPFLTYSILFAIDQVNSIFHFCGCPLFLFSHREVRCSTAQQTQRQQQATATSIAPTSNSVLQVHLFEVLSESVQIQCMDATIWFVMFLAKGNEGRNNDNQHRQAAVGCFDSYESHLDSYQHNWADLHYPWEKKKREGRGSWRADGGGTDFIWFLFSIFFFFFRLCDVTRHRSFQRECMCAFLFYLFCL